MNKEILLSEVLTQTVANAFKNPSLSWVNALQQAISNLEKDNRVKAKILFESLDKSIRWDL